MMHPNHSHTQNRSNLFNKRRYQHSSSFYPSSHPLSLPSPPPTTQKKKEKKKRKKRKKKEKSHSSISSIPTLFQNITSNIRTNLRLTSHSTQLVPFRIRNQRIIWCMIGMLRVILPRGNSSRELREQECGKEDETVDFHAEG